MAIPQTIPRGAAGRPSEWCEQIVALAQRWKLDASLALKLAQVASHLPFDIQIISGYRTPAEQERELARPDSSAAAVDLSNHTICPARAADLHPLVAETDAVKLAIGEAAQLHGLRWGGGARRDSKGIPEGREWRHVDLGPRPR